MKRWNTKQIADYYGVHPNSIKNWVKEGKLTAYLTEGGHYRFDPAQKKENNLEKVSIGYCRVSSKKQSDDLQRQKELVENYLISKGEPFTIIEDIGSGINYTKKGLLEMIEMVVSGKVKKIYVLHKDRLLRFGFELLESIFNLYNVDIEIINQVKESDEAELVKDMIQIVTVFSAKLNGKRSHQLNKIKKDLGKVT